MVDLHSVSRVSLVSLVYPRMPSDFAKSSTISMSTEILATAFMIPAPKIHGRSIPHTNRKVPRNAQNPVVTAKENWERSAAHARITLGSYL